MKKPELLAPIQDYVSLNTAISAGADAVYFGIKGFNMRAGAKNFTIRDLGKIVRLAKENNIKTYLALNTIIYENELEELDNILVSAKKSGVDAVICWDYAVIMRARELGIEVHLSTQASVSNSTSADFYHDLGISRIVLARECSIEHIKEIQKKTDIEIEIFVHGAMCVSVSGRCFLSQYSFGKSANRGECLQPCRRKYVIREIDRATDDSNAREFEIGEDYVLSPRDLCTIPFFEQILTLGVACLKIEGRNRSPEYVKNVVSVYREAIDYYFENHHKKDFGKNWEDLKIKWLKKLGEVYNRDFGNGFYLGKPIKEWTHSYGSQATVRKIHIGKITKFYPKISVAEIEIQAGKKLRAGDHLLVQGESTGIVEEEIKSMEIDHSQVKLANQGDVVAVKFEHKVRANDLVYKISKLS